MKFKKEFYHFQNDILAKFESEIKSGEKKIHIVAPPWSGKTIVWLEMVSRISWNALILVPNITLQYQWKDKLEKLFLEANENIEDLVSTDVSVVKKINIITYQALTQSGEWDDLIMQKILENWFNDVKEEFKDYKNFEIYLENLKNENPDDFVKTLAKYRKKQKNITNVEKLLTQKVKDYFQLLKDNNIEVIVVDEAHHLTNWWSSVIFYLWNYLGERFIVWLTATPPFENTDFFVLDDDYSNLLWEVDFYVPQPAIVKSWKLAPYQDLVYFVEPGEELKSNLAKFEIQLQWFLQEHNAKICEVIYTYIEENYEKLLKEKSQILLNYLRYLYNYSDKDLSNFVFWEENWDKVKLEDIAKTVWKYVSSEKINSNKNFDEIKKIFYNLGYIWRAANFYRFRTPIEMQLIYSKSKIIWVEKILDEEINTLWNDLRCAIITDFLDENENNFLNSKFILESIKTKYKKYNPVLVSGQGNFQFWKNGEIEILNETILEITQRFSDGKMNILIWTRWVLWEWWDCPKLNTLIDLTGIVAYMSVNQVRGRAIRLDLDNPKKTSNVYDVVCVWQGMKGNIDVERLLSKHDKFYGIDDSWLIIKWADHIYPDLKENYIHYEKINQNMLKRVTLRDYIYDLWGINGTFSNKEIFWLNLHVENYGQILPIMDLNIIEKFKLAKFFRKGEVKINEIWEKDFYHKLFMKFFNRFVAGIVKTLKQNETLPKDFSYKIIYSTDSDIKIVSYYIDDIIIKSFITYIAKTFSIISTQKYVFDIQFASFDGKELSLENYYFWLWDEVSRNEEIRKKLKINIHDSINIFLIVLKVLWAYSVVLIILAILEIFLYVNFGILETLLIFFSWFFLHIWFLGILIFILLWFYYIIFNIKFNYNLFIVEYLWFKKNYNIIYINSNKVNKKDYVGKKPFITSKIEKLWI